MRLGIDFGTTRTVVAAVDDGRHPVAAFDEGGEFRDYIPGIAALHRGSLVVGWEAARALIMRAAGAEPTAAALERAREAKETLKATTRKLVVEVGGEPVTLDTADLYARAAPLIHRTIAQIDLLFERLRERGIDPDDPRELWGEPHRG